MRKLLFALACTLSLAAASNGAEAYTSRFVWVFGWGLNSDKDVAAITEVLDSAGRHGMNGAVLSAGLDTLCRQPADYFRRLKLVQQACESNHLDLIPAIFSVGYGGCYLAHDRNLAEGLPVTDAPFLTKDGDARLVPNPSVTLANGGFENHPENKLPVYDFYDQPGEIGFIDTEVKHGGLASLRLERFTNNPHGHGRIMQTVKVEPHRCYRLSLWVKTSNLRPANAFRMMVLGNNRDLAPRQFNLPTTTDWRKISMLFNSLECDKVQVYAGMWEGKAGAVWLDDWTLEEVGPVNVLRRPGTPVFVKSEDGTTTFVEGKDYAPLVDPNFSPWRDTDPAIPLKLLPGGAIQSGQRLRVSWYHSLLIHDSQVTVCMAEPKLYEIADHEAKLLAEQVHPRRVLLNMDEVRLGGTCAVCRGHDMAELIGQCVARQADAIHRYLPQAEVMVWSDMFDPNHNAHPKYYLVNGDYTGSWRHVPKNIVMAVWGGEPRPKSLRFFSDEGFRTLVACYYDADNLNDVRAWLDAARGVPGVTGFMYTPWERKYSLLPDFADLIRDSR